jgi:muramoyltetrapeptide carboxypeptidase
MRKPRALRPGDRVAIVAPASGCSAQELEGGMAELRRLGFDPVHTPAVSERALFSAGSAEVRARDFLAAWADPSVAALVAVRGGYGSAQLLPYLDPVAVAHSPKLFIGYSDTTAILSWLTCHVGMTALHGPMVERRLSKGAEGYDVASFLAMSSGDTGVVLACDAATVVRDGEARGVLVGGTLTQLVASLGTPYAFAPPEGCILFIEDVNERPYRVHRMLTQLTQAGVLSRARGVVFGEMRGCDEPDGGPTAVDAIRHALDAFAGPVFCGFPSGHTSGPLVTLPFGARVRVSTRAGAAVAVEESPVA